jgi:hypothetical protein
MKRIGETDPVVPIYIVPPYCVVRELAKGICAPADTLFLCSIGLVDGGKARKFLLRRGGGLSMVSGYNDRGRQNLAIPSCPRGANRNSPVM